MGEVRIECFHRVVPDAEREAQWPYFARGTAMTVSEFEACLAALASRYEMVDEMQASELLWSNSPSTPACWITFDDGYRDCLEHVAPIVGQYGVRPSLFMTTRALEGDWWPPVDLWYSTLKSAGGQVVTVKFGGFAERWDLATNSGRQRAVSGPLKATYVASQPSEQRQMLAVLSEAVGAKSAEKPVFLSRDELELLSQLGWTVGPHGHEHFLLAQVGTDAVIEDLLRSEDVLDNLSLKVRSQWIAYSDGQYDTSVLLVAQRRFANRGYRGGLTIDGQIAGRRNAGWATPRYIARA